MKASELRIGNYVNLYGDDCQIQTLGQWVHTETTVDEAPIESVKPIPLSEEWLERFGFERHHNNKSLFVEQTQTGGVELMKDGTFEFCIGDIFFEVKYVHQLQNLYFALTGEELTLKEK